MNTAGECYDNPGNYEETHYPSAIFTSPSEVNGTVRFYYNDNSTSEVAFSVGDTSVNDHPFTCGCFNSCIYLTNAVVL